MQYSLNFLQKQRLFSGYNHLKNNIIYFEIFIIYFIMNENKGFVKKMLTSILKLDIRIVKQSLSNKRLPISVLIEKSP